VPHMRVQGPGEGWIDIFDPGYFWMQITPRGTYDLSDADTPLPTVAPGDVATAETCFRLPDGGSVCVLTNDPFATDYAGLGYPEISPDAPEFLPPIVAEVPRLPGPVVVPSDAKEEIPGDQTEVAIDWGTVFSSAVDIANTWGQQPIYNFGGGTAGPPTQVPTTSMLNGAAGGCGCGRSPCVCGTDSSGRPALIDPRTGKRCYRRRRRVMLTEGDFNTLLRISTLPNTKNVSVALAKAIGRR